MEARKVVLITGASTGIGLATAEKLLAQNYFVVLTARESSLHRFHDLESLRHSDQHWIRPLDVTNSVQRRECIDEIERKLGRLDILINNAGIIYRTPLEFAYDFESKEQMQVNFHAPLEMIKICLPAMRRLGAGHIVNVSSAAGFFSVPTMGLYAASKHALEGASEALQHELRPWNIRLTLVQPGFVSSKVYHHSAEGLAFARQWRQSPFYALQNRTVSALVEKAVQLTTTTPEKVAAAIHQLVEMRRPPLRAQVTLDAQVFHFLKRFLPESLFDRLVRGCLNIVSRQALPSAS